MAVTVNVLSTQFQNSGSEKKVDAQVSMTGTYDSLTGVILNASDFGLSQINSLSIEHGSTYVFGYSVNSSKLSASLRLYDSSLIIGGAGQLDYNANLGAFADLTARLYIDTVVGSYIIGETITGGTSGATSTVISFETDLYSNQRLVIGAPGAGSFIAAEVITGGTSGATSTSVDETHLTYDIGGGGAAPLHAVEADDGGGFVRITSFDVFSPLLSTAGYRYIPNTSTITDGKIECLESDAYLQVRAAGTDVNMGAFDSLPEVITGFALSGLTNQKIEIWGY